MNPRIDIREKIVKPFIVQNCILASPLEHVKQMTTPLWSLLKRINAYRLENELTFNTKTFLEEFDKIVPSTVYGGEKIFFCGLYQLKAPNLEKKSKSNSYIKEFILGDESHF